MVIRTNQLVVHKAKVAVFSENLIKHVNTLCGQNVELLNVKARLRKGTAGLLKG